MPTKSLECQIATGQIGRYLSGESLSGDVLRQLEAHVSECPDCKQTIAERRQALLSMLEPNGGPLGVQKAAVQAPTPTPSASLRDQSDLLREVASLTAGEARSKLDIQEALRAAILKNQAAAYAATSDAEATSNSVTGAESKTKRRPKSASSARTPTFGKPLMYAAALAVVLIGMGYASRSGLFLGPKAIASFLPSAANENPSATDTPNKPEVTTVTTNVADAMKSSTTPLPTPSVPSAAAAPTDPTADPSSKSGSPTQPTVSSQPADANPVPTDKGIQESPTQQNSAAPNPTVQGPVTNPTPGATATEPKPPVTTSPPSTSSNETPKVTRPPQNKITADLPTRRSPRRRTRRTTPRRPSSSTTIRVYDANGNPIR